MAALDPKIAAAIVEYEWSMLPNSAPAWNKHGKLMSWKDARVCRWEWYGGQLGRNLGVAARLLEEGAIG